MRPSSDHKLLLPSHVRNPPPRSHSHPDETSPPSSPDSEQGHAYPLTDSSAWGNHVFLNEQRKKDVTHRSWVSLVLLLLLVLAIAALSGASDAVNGLNEQKSLVAHRGFETVAKWKEWFTQQAEHPFTQDEVEVDPSVPATGPIKISVQPRPRLADKNDKETKYLTYIPHSGFHNQRVELELALHLGYLLNRTVLVPPIWLGWPAPGYPSDKLQKIWTGLVASHGSSFGLNDTWPDSSLSRPIHFRTVDDDEAPIQPSRGMERHVRRAAGDCTGAKVAECRDVYKDTFLSWDFLSNLDSIASLVPMVDRWDMRPRALLESLGLSQEDVLLFKNKDVYEFRFSDIGPLGEPDSPLLQPVLYNKGGHQWKRWVSIGALRQRPERLLMIGSMFGWGRVISSSEAFEEAKEQITRAMVFRNSWLTAPADEIALRLGGDYLGVHARIADGGFLRRAREHMEMTWRNLMLKLEVDEELIERLWSDVKPAETDQLDLVARGEQHQAEYETTDYSFLDEEEDIAGDEEEFAPTPHKRWWFDSAPRTSWTTRNLTCRAPLYTQPEMLKLNKPLYLATDSRDPVKDPHLAIFFKTFPCTFILSDFNQPSSINDGLIVDSLERMGRLVNEADGVPLGGTLTPFLEALLVSKADELVGTLGSTFSGFAEGAMHRVAQQEKAAQY